MQQQSPFPMLAEIAPADQIGTRAHRIAARAEILTGAAQRAKTKDAWSWARTSHQQAADAYSAAGMRGSALYHQREADRCGKEWINGYAH